jgi:hypothetical protein
MKPTTQQEAREAQLRAFTEYFVRNYPGPDTIIHNPQWHAARIFRAAEHAIAYHRPASTPGPVPLARVMEQFTPAEREEIAADAARLNAAVPVPDEAVERARAAYAFHAEHADHDDCLHAALTAAGYFALREERDALRERLLDKEVDASIVTQNAILDLRKRAESAERELAEVRARLAEVEKDAVRYRWLRDQHWSTSTLCAVASPQNAVKLGYYCPSGAQLDSEIDAARATTTQLSTSAEPNGSSAQQQGGE